MGLTRQQKTWIRYFLRKFIGEIPAGERLRKYHVVRALGAALEEGPVRAALDAGSGDGVYSFWIAGHAPEAEVKGWDLDEARIEGCAGIAEGRGHKRLEFKAFDITQLDAKDELDLITCSEVMEHLEDDAGQARRFFEALRPGGRLVMHVPTGQGPHPLLKNPPPDPYHVRDGYTREEMTALLTSAGFEVVETYYTCGFWGSLAHDIFTITKYPAIVRLMTFPLTAVLVAVDVRTRPGMGQGLLVRARKATP